MRTVVAMSALCVYSFGAAGIAQTDRPVFAGRRLVEPATAEPAQNILVVNAPDELLITQTPFAITISHPSRPGTHPEAGTLEYGSGGFVGDSGGLTPLLGTWGVTHIGTQLMISRTTTYPPDERGVRSTVARGSIWRLETPSRLVIEFGEERAGERPKNATRVYLKVAP